MQLVKSLFLVSGSFAADVKNNYLINQSAYKPAYTYGLFLLLACVLLFRLEATPIYILDEAKNAQCAREMMENNNWIVPTFNGELRTDKPPLHYFFMIAAYKVFGTTEFAARFFSVVMGLLTVLVTFLYTKRLYNSFTAFCSTLVLVASTHFLFEFRLSVPDPYLIFFITLGLFSAFTWLQRSDVKQLYISASALGLAILAKGPIALALPGLCLLIWIIISKNWKPVFTWHLISAGFLLFLIAIPWYYAVDKATDGAWTKGFFIDNNLNRFSDPKEGHGGFFLVTVVFVLVGLLPFMSFIGEVIRQRKIIFINPLVKFGAIVTVVFVVFFSISSTKLPNYPMPCYPFAAVVLGTFIAKLLNKEVTSKKYPWYILLVFTLALPVAGYFAIKAEPEATTLANWLPALLLFAPIFMLGATFLQKSGWLRRIEMIILSFTALNIIVLAYAYPELYKQNPVAKTIDMVRAAPNVYAFDIFNPGYRFYIDKDIPRAFDKATMQHWLDSTGNAIIITRTDYLDSLKGLPLQEVARHHDIFELPT
ncbi:MAG: glycosyltransferase family 39 protein, partial [Panacibacter sp.]